RGLLADGSDAAALLDDSGKHAPTIAKAHKSPQPGGNGGPRRRKTGIISRLYRNLQHMYERTHSCGQLRDSHVGQTVSLAGWVNSYRDHGGVIFIDLRDREGLTQVVFHPEHKEAHDLADKLRSEDVVWVKGKCVKREPGMANPKLPTGAIEVQASELQLLNK